MSNTGMLFAEPPRGGAGGYNDPGANEGAHQNFGEDPFFLRSLNFDRKNC